MMFRIQIFLRMRRNKKMEIIEIKNKEKEKEAGFVKVGVKGK